MQRGCKLCIVVYYQDKIKKGCKLDHFLKCIVSTMMSIANIVIFTHNRNVIRKYFLLLVTLSLKIILITTNDVKLHIQRHVLSSDLEKNDSQK